MKFETIPLAEAAGAYLAHSVRAGGLVFKKGRRLSAADVAGLDAAGVASVQAVVLAADDVHEDAAAARVAASLAGAHAQAAAPFTGRVNLVSQATGLLVIDREKIDAANRVHEAITIATLAPFAQVTPKTLLATVKIIPFAAPEAAVAQVEQLLRAGPPAIAVAPYQSLRAAYVKAAEINEKSVRITEARLDGLGVELIRPLHNVPAHTVAAFGAAIGRALGDGPDILLVQGNSATVDRDDVIPSAIVAQNGRIVHFGMPVDPGNLLLIAEKGRTKIIVMPGCARSPTENGFDWVLQRMVAGLEVGPSDIQAMGVGGLLKEIGSRPEPRQGAKQSSGKRPRFAGVLLAAGLSRRMGANKLLQEWQGKPLVRHVGEAMTAADLSARIAVLGHMAEEVEAALKGLPVQIVRAPHFEQGMSQSLEAGLAALPDSVDAAIILLGDMPRLKAEHMGRLMSAFDAEEGRTICIPTFEGRRGNPVLFGRAYFEELMAVEGDMGGRQVIQANGDAVVEVPMPDDAIFLDVDTPEALKNLRGRD